MYRDAMLKNVQAIVLIALLSSVVELPVFAQLRHISAVVDGDRIVLSDGTRIQLMGLDAPEKHYSAKLTRDAARSGRSEEAIAQQGEIAAAYLSAISLGERVIVSDTEKAYVAPGGPYIQAIVHVADERGHIVFSLNERMLADGYAYFDSRAVFARRAEYADLAHNAKTAGLGLWALPGAYGRPSGLPDSRNSEGMDPLGRCRDEPTCVWVTGSSGGEGVGFWRSKPGMKCSCDAQ